MGRIRGFFWSKSENPAHPCTLLSEQIIRYDSVFLDGSIIFKKMRPRYKEAAKHKTRPLGGRLCRTALDADKPFRCAPWDRLREPGLPFHEGENERDKGGWSGFTEFNQCYRCGTAPDLNRLSPLCATHPGGWRTIIKLFSCNAVNLSPYFQFVNVRFITSTTHKGWRLIQSAARSRLDQAERRGGPIPDLGGVLAARQAIGPRLRQRRSPDGVKVRMLVIGYLTASCTACRHDTKIVVATSGPALEHKPQTIR